MFRMKFLARIQIKWNCHELSFFFFFDILCQRIDFDEDKFDKGKKNRRRSLV